jgi:hypothetical protein
MTNPNKCYCDVCIYFSDSLTVIPIKKIVVGLEQNFTYCICPTCLKQILEFKK